MRAAISGTVTNSPSRSTNSEPDLPRGPVGFRFINKNLATSDGYPGVGARLRAEGLNDQHSEVQLLEIWVESDVVACVPPQPSASSSTTIPDVALRDSTPVPDVVEPHDSITLVTHELERRRRCTFEDQPHDLPVAYLQRLDLHHLAADGFAELLIQGASHRPSHAPASRPTESLGQDSTVKGARTAGSGRPGRAPSDAAEDRLPSRLPRPQRRPHRPAQLGSWRMAARDRSERHRTRHCLHDAAHVRDERARRRPQHFELARYMGTSVEMIDRTYGHLAAGSEQAARDKLDAVKARI
jgi:hypothetical protein